jgi:hypothetical protein
MIPSSLLLNPDISMEWGCQFYIANENYIPDLHYQLRMFRSSRYEIRHDKPIYRYSRYLRPSYRLLQ